MSIKITDNANGIVTVQVAGRLAQSEIAWVQQEAAGIIAKQGRIRLLIVTENFQGWEGDGDWGDVSFAVDHDADIERMAIVGDKQWRDLALIFVAKGFRKFPIEYFQPDHLAQARAWLAEKPK